MQAVKRGRAARTYEHATECAPYQASKSPKHGHAASGDRPQAVHVLKQKIAADNATKLSLIGPVQDYSPMFQVVAMVKKHDEHYRTIVTTSSTTLN